MEKRGQVAVFVIIALVIVAGIGTYFAVRNLSGTESENAEFSEVFSYYEGCLEQYARTGISAAGSRGGWIEGEEYSAGSNYAPFGNQLLVAGSEVPYWMTVTGNGLIDENVPTQNQVEEQLETYIEERIEGCSMDEFRERGLSVSVSAAQAQATIAADGILIDVVSAVSVASENASSQRNDFSVRIDTQFGTLLREAQRIYQYEQESLFIENYSFDVLRLYAPVDGVEIKCAPSVWNVQDVFADLQEGLEQNLISLRFDGEQGYFNVDSELSGVDGVQVIYDSTWPSRFEVYGNQGSLLVANPIGSQSGLNAMGFCYVPYHFVYDMMFPTLFRLTAGEDMFQFPVVAVIDKNVPRNAIQSSFAADYAEESDLCQASTKDVAIQVRDSRGAVAGAEVSYNCFDQSCRVGETNANGNVQGKLPACINGYLEVRSEAHAPVQALFSSHNSTSAVVYAEIEYPVNVNLIVDGRESSALSFISLVGETGSKQAMIPDGNAIQLSPGFYNLTVYQYGNTSIRIPASTTQECIEVSAGGIAGIFGRTKEQCFPIAVPETIIESALTAGGSGEVYLPEELLESGALTVSVQSFPRPTTLAMVQDNYALFDVQGADVIYG